jgi:hypothetical protein
MEDSMGVKELTVDEKETARVALSQAWKQLAPIADDARRLQSESTRDPSLLNDSWVVALIRWSAVFEREIAAVQKVHEAAEGGSKLPLDDVRTAVSIARKLIDTIGTAAERVGHTSGNGARDVVAEYSTESA